MPEHLQTPDKLQDAAGEIEAPLRRWHIQRLNWMLTVSRIVGLPAIALLVNDYIHAQEA